MEKMNREIIAFGDNKIEKCKFQCYENQIFRRYVC